MKNIFPFFLIALFCITLVSAVEIFQPEGSDILHNNLRGLQGTGSDYFHLNQTQINSINNVSSTIIASSIWDNNSNEVFIKSNFPQNLSLSNGNFTWDDTNNRLGIGTTTPERTLYIFRDRTVDSENAVIQAVTSGGATAFKAIAYRDSTGQTTFSGEYSRGTKTSPTIVSNNDLLFNFQARGHDGNDFRHSSAIDFHIDGTPTTTRMPGEIIFKVQETGNTWGSLRDVLNIKKTGKVGIGTGDPQNQLDVEGSAAIGASYSGTNAAPTNGLIVEGDVGIGTTTPLVDLHMVREGQNTLARLDTYSNTATQNGAFLMTRFRGTKASPLVVQDDDEVGELAFQAQSTTTSVSSSSIKALVDGIPSAGSVPIRIAFVTGTNALDRKERFKILSNGQTEHLMAAASTIHNMITYSSNSANRPIFEFKKSHTNTEESLVATLDGENLGDIQWYGVGTSTPSFDRGASIRAIQDGTAGTTIVPIRLEFLTSPGGSTVEQTRMTIKPDGNVGIGTTTPDTNVLLHVKSSDNVQNQIKMENTNSGTGASASLRAKNDVGDEATLFAYGSGYSGTSAGLPLASMGLVNFANFDNVLFRTNNDIAMSWAPNNAVAMDLTGDKSNIFVNTSITGDLNVTGNYINGANTGLTGNFSVGSCWMAYSGGIMYNTNCTTA